MIKFESLNEYNDVWLTSDTHYSHKNICRGVSTWEGEGSHSVRDFDTVEQMNDALIKGINDYVKEEDVIIHCGDVAFAGIGQYYEFLERVNCKNFIHLRGNHCHQKEHANLKDIGYFQFQGFKLMAMHYPAMIWHQSHKDVRLAFGHVHGSNPGVGRSQDVGVDVAYRMFGEYRVFHWSEFRALTDKKKKYLESHHNENTN